MQSAVETGRDKDLSDIDKGHFIMARRQVQNISKTARLVRSSQSAVVSTYSEWSDDNRKNKASQHIVRILALMRIGLKGQL